MKNVTISVPEEYLCTRCEEGLRMLQGGALLDCCKACHEQTELQESVLMDWHLLLGGTDQSEAYYDSDEYQNKLDAVGRLIGWAGEKEAEGIDAIAEALGMTERWMR